MIRPTILSLLTLSAALLACASVAAAPDRSPAVAAARADAVATRYKLAGELLVARGGRILIDRGYGTVSPEGGPPHRAGERWRLASITKQVTAALFMRGLTQGLVPSLDDGPEGGITWRMMLTHHSGLPNPDDTPADAAGVPAFYRQRLPLSFDYCSSKPGRPNAPFAYNKCDYLLLGAALGGPKLIFDPGSTTSFWPRGLSMAAAGEKGVPGFVHGKPEPAFELANFSTAGGLVGTARAVFDFDRSLMTGNLLSPAALAELWKPEGNGSYQALGQWVFPGKLAGCAAPKRIVQRDGEIYGVQARNFILPDDDLVVIVFTNRSSDDFALGEVWEGKGFVYDLLSAAACG